MSYATSLAAALLAAFPVLSHAQDFSGAVTLGYGDSDVSDVDQDITTRTFDGRLDVGFGNGFSFGARFDRIDGSLDGVSGDVTGDLFGLALDYAFGNGFAVGAYWEDASIGIDGVPGDLSARSYGLSASYETAGMEFGGYYGDKSSDILAGIDAEDYGLTFRYDAGTQFLVGGNFGRTNLSSGGTSVDLDMIGVAGSYAFSDQWAAFAGISRTSVDLADLDITTMGLGVSYDFSAATSFGGIASLELARTDADLGGGDGSIDTVRLGFTIPFGANASKVPLNSVADSILNPSHAVLSSTVLSAF